MAKEVLKLVVFTMETEITVYEYGIPIEQVYEITCPSNTIKLPGMPTFVEGIMNLRGSVIPVIDIKKRFNLGATVSKDTTRIVVVQINEQKCGIIVDDVLEIIPISAENIDEAPKFAGGVSSQFIIGIGKIDSRLIIALDMNKILNEDEEKELLNVV